MVAIGAVLVVSLSILATRIGSLAFEATGLSREAAHFQARSAFTGLGFTTSEAESITGQPARRRIASVLMLLGNAGIVSIIASLVLGFAEAAPRQALQRLGVLVVGLGLLLVIVRSERFAALPSRMVERRLTRWAEVDTRDYVRLLGISDDDAVREAKVEPNGCCRADSWPSSTFPGKGSWCWACGAPTGPTSEHRRPERRCGPATTCCSTATGTSHGGGPSPRGWRRPTPA